MEIESEVGARKTLFLFYACYASFYVPIFIIPIALCVVEFAYATNSLEFIAL